MKFVMVDLVNRMRPRSNQAHFPAQHVPKLRQFVEAVAADNTADAMDGGVGPRTRRQIGTGTNVQVITERGRGSLSRLGWLAGKSEDDFVDEFGASEPVQICDSPQYCRGKRQVIIYEATDSRAV